MKALVVTLERAPFVLNAIYFAVSFIWSELFSRATSMISSCFVGDSVIYERILISIGTRGEMDFEISGMV